MCGGFEMEFVYDDYSTKLIGLLKEICLIPSPTGHEEKKAQFVKQWLENIGNGVNPFIDEVNNVILQMGDKNKPRIVFMSHIDTVFQFETKLEFVDLYIFFNNTVYCCDGGIIWLFGKG